MKNADAIMKKPACFNCASADKKEDIQFRQIGLLYGAVKYGDRFVVAPVSSLDHPQLFGYPYNRITEPDVQLVPDGRLIYAPGYIPLENFRAPKMDNPACFPQFLRRF